MIPLDINNFCTCAKSYLKREKDFTTAASLYSCGFLQVRVGQVQISLRENKDSRV